ncbi:metallophosphoesterase [Paenibacillus pini]|uniref:Ser/Thr protein phosphatase family protein n=1 Tax=Paenibacillus pini JCM 16418 TaxID=1236976 RepID=W7YQW0_9BACL|nr:metallophosphoesterase [Paenibacillus pini]GAF06991.1 Ser/Thr protein phosphatase family protein [Paenibacillus pini JCM 16418]
MKLTFRKPTFFKRLTLLILVLLMSLGAIYYYARYVEPNLLRLEEVSISTSVTRDLDELRIVQISDIHLGKFYSLDKLSKLVARINGLKPDLVVFTGDLIDNFSQYDETSGVAPILKQIKAPLGKYAVYGNHDQGGGGKHKYPKLMSSSGFKVLINEHKVLTIGSSQFVIAGLDDYLLGSPNLKKTFKNVPADAFVLLLVHEPDIADRLNSYPVDLQLSGHSHGGQVQMPGYGSVYTPPLAQKYREGLYTFDSGRSKPLNLYVNRGIGTTRLPFRFDSVPEVTLLTLQHAASH